MISYLHWFFGWFVNFLQADPAPSSRHTHIHLHTAFLNANRLVSKLHSDALYLLATSAPPFAALIILLIASRAAAAVFSAGMKVFTLPENY